MSEEKNIEQENKKSDASDEHELDLMELEIYRKMWNEINSALADIRALRNNDTVESDPVQLIKNEMSALKKDFAELREAISKINRPSEVQPQNQQQMMQAFQPVQPTVPLMPYFSTPSYQPMIQIPH